MTLCARSLSDAVLVAVLCWARPVSAYRPFDGTDADVAAPGEVELEIGPLGYRRQASARTVVAPALVANYGFAPRFEAVLEGRQEFPVNAEEHRWQVRDSAFSVKGLLRRGSLQGRTGPSVALETGLLFPTAESRLGAHIGSIISIRLPAVTFHLNLNNNLFVAVRYEASASLILEGPSTWRLRPVAEGLVEREFGSGGIDDGLAESLLVGGIACWTDAVSFDLGARVGRANSRRDDELRLGLTWAFEPW